MIQSQDPIQNGDDLNQNRYLTQRLAERRANQILKHSLSYTVHLLLKKGEQYEALVNLRFKTTNQLTDLFLDYRGTELLGLIVNGVRVQEPNWNKLFIIIPKELLKTGHNDENELNLRIRSKYQSDGTGLHSFTDVDQKQYLYSQGESYFCNRFFPCMDQPNLKGTLQFKIVAPKEWTVISNESPLHQNNFEIETLQNETKDQLEEWVIDLYNNLPREDYKYWVYERTKPLPSYLYCVIAGEYWSIKDDNNYISQTIYCRESLKEHMLKLKDFVFEVTRESMKFYEKYFGVPYQFSKYDSIFCAEYNWGAMENPGCVTFNDFYVFREQKEASKYTQLANTIAHEMAHHWFGDYVTMTWWNDLWLNESYADFISHFCLENLDIQSIKLTNIGVMFNSRKGWGYREDQMITTHPIAGNIENTEVAENIFDGITYSKGASCMKQLMFLIGQEGFGRGCGNYFKKFAWDNATLSDLIEFLDVEFKLQNHPFTLQEWQQEWIQKAGLNEALPEWNPNDLSNNAQLVIHQGVALENFNTLRRHKIKIAFFTQTGDIIVQDALIKNQSKTIINYDGSLNFKAILLNYEDHSFIKTLLDQNSIDFFSKNLHSIKDNLTRQLVWRAFFDSVRDGKISSEEYTEIIINNSPNEISDEILSTQLLYLQSAVHNMTPNKYKEILSGRVFKFLLNLLQKNINGQNETNRVVMLKEKLLSFSDNNEDIEILYKWFKGEFEPLKDLSLSLGNKWRIVQLVHQSNQFNSQQQNEIFDQLSAIDKSDQQIKMRKYCNALVANEEGLKQFWESFIDSSNKESAKLQAYTMAGFNQSRKLQILKPYHQLFFDSLIDVFDQRSTDFAKEFYYNLFPNTDDVNYLDQNLNDVLQRTPARAETLRLSIRKSLDDVSKKSKQFQCFEKRAPLAQTQNL